MVKLSSDIDIDGLIKMIKYQHHHHHYYHHHQQQQQLTMSHLEIACCHMLSYVAFVCKEPISRVTCLWKDKLMFTSCSPFEPYCGLVSLKKMSHGLVYSFEVTRMVGVEMIATVDTATIATEMLWEAWNSEVKQEKAWTKRARQLRDASRTSRSTGKNSEIHRSNSKHILPLWFLKHSETIWHYLKLFCLLWSLHISSVFSDSASGAFDRTYWAR